MLRQAQHDEAQIDGISCDRWTASDHIVRARHLATPTPNTLARLPFPVTPLPVMLSLSKHATASRKRRIGGHQHAGGEVMLRQAQHDEAQMQSPGAWSGPGAVRGLAVRVR
ncbi:MAG: hypothetical protein AMXMBFR61_21330 [Fimbriimonadales bacterium]